MSYKVLQQPQNGFALYSTINEEFLLVNATLDQITDELLKMHREVVRERVDREIQGWTRQEAVKRFNKYVQLSKMSKTANIDILADLDFDVSEEEEEEED